MMNLQIRSTALQRESASIAYSLQFRLLKRFSAGLRGANTRKESPFIEARRREEGVRLPAAFERVDCRHFVV